jgi:phytol kinase
VELIYRRRLRKLIHILAGLPSFLLAYVSYPIALACALAAVTAAFMLRPEHPWLRMLVKPEDIQQHRISGVRHYFIAVLILIAVFGLHHPLIAAAGWLALAWGDGAAGLVGRKDAMKLPWSSRKTVIGGHMAGSRCYTIRCRCPGKLDIPKRAGVYRTRRLARVAAGITQTAIR